MADVLIPRVPGQKDTLLARFTESVALVLNGLYQSGAIIRTGLATFELALSSIINVVSGGTGRTSLTDHALLVGSGTSPVDAVGPGAIGTVLQGAGSSADPTFTATPTLGEAGTTIGTLALAGNTSGTVSIKPQPAAGTFNFNLPTGAGTAGQSLLSGGGGTNPMTWGSASATDPRTSIYNPFTPAGVDDEFDNASFTGWTLVDDGTHQATVTEVDDFVSLLLPGGDTAGHLHAWMKSATVAVGDIIEMAFNGTGLGDNSQMCGLIMADGNTYGVGTQVCVCLVPNAASNYLIQGMTNYNSQFTFVQKGLTANGLATIFIRLKYASANNWTGYISCDGTSWVDMTGAVGITMTPTHVGFFASTWGAPGPYNWSIRYFRKTT